MDVIVETEDGSREFTIRIDVSDTVLKLKEKIQRCHEIPISSQNLFFNCLTMIDDSITSDYLIYNGARLLLQIIDEPPLSNPDQDRLLHDDDPLLDDESINLILQPPNNQDHRRPNDQPASSSSSSSAAAAASNSLKVYVTIPELNKEFSLTDVSSTVKGRIVKLWIREFADLPASSEFDVVKISSKGGNKTDQHLTVKNLNMNMIPLLDHQDLPHHNTDQSANWMWPKIRLLILVPELQNKFYLHDVDITITTVGQLKQRIREVCRLSASTRFRLNFIGKELDDDNQTLDKYGIVNFCSVAVKMDTPIKTIIQEESSSSSSLLNLRNDERIQLLIKVPEVVFSPNPCRDHYLIMELSDTIGRLKERIIRYKVLEGVLSVNSTRFKLVFEGWKLVHDNLTLEEYGITLPLSEIMVMIDDAPPVTVRPLRPPVPPSSSKRE